MLVYVIGAILAALFVLWGLERFKRANPALLAQRMRLIGGWGLVAAGVLMVLRGGFAYGIPLLMFGASLLTNGTTLLGRMGGASPSPGRTSKVVTDYLEMMLDHATGAMDGRVLKGVFAGRAIGDLAPAELALLWRDCRFTDPSSAQLIEAWLDRTHPTWREDMARAEGQSGPGGIMSRAEALEILGLAEGASADEIRVAHRTLMKRMHPDAGGSGYLAAKINEAKDLLLGR